MIDMPVIIEEATPSAGIDLGSISTRVADFTPVTNMIRQVWNTQTLSQLMEGRVAVPDEVINESLAKYIDEGAPIYNINVTSLGDNKLRLIAETKKFGKVDFLCRIDQFQHNKDISFLKFTILEKNLPDQGLLSWVVSRLSLSMVEKLVGHIDFGDTVSTKVVRDTVAIDFHEALSGTEFGKANLLGYKISDALVIESAEPKNGYIEVKTSLDMPESVKNALYNILK